MGESAATGTPVVRVLASGPGCRGADPTSKAVLLQVVASCCVGQPSHRRTMLAPSTGSMWLEASASRARWSAWGPVACSPSRPRKALRENWSNRIDGASDLPPALVPRISS